MLFNILSGDVYLYTYIYMYVFVMCTYYIVHRMLMISKFFCRIDQACDSTWTHLAQQVKLLFRCQHQHPVMGRLL